MFFILSFTVLAEDKPLRSYTTNRYGLSINLDTLSRSDHYLVPMEYGVLSHAPYVSALGIRYFALAKDTVKEMNDSYYTLSEKDQAKIDGIIGYSAATIGYIVVSNAEDSQEAILSTAVVREEVCERWTQAA